MVRPPGFEPGSSAWQADVLDQARLRPQASEFRYLFIMVFLKSIMFPFLLDLSILCLFFLTVKIDGLPLVFTV
jgi:hypothetical protein